MRLLRLCLLILALRLFLSEPMVYLVFSLILTTGRIAGCIQGADADNGQIFNPNPRKSQEESAK